MAAPQFPAAQGLPEPFEDGPAFDLAREGTQPRPGAACALPPLDGAEVADLAQDEQRVARGARQGFVKAAPCVRPARRRKGLGRLVGGRAIRRG